MGVIGIDDNRFNEIIDSVMIKENKILCEKCGGAEIDTEKLYK